MLQACRGSALITITALANPDAKVEIQATL